MPSEDENWAGLAEQLNHGSQLAYLKLTRLVVGTLIRLRAYDFQSEWSDLVQEVLTDLVQKVRAGKITDRSTVKALVIQMTKNKYMDRLRKYYRRDERDALPWDEMCEQFDPLAAGSESKSAQSLDLNLALSALDEKERQIVVAIHCRGMTYDEASESTGIPLGSTKRYLRQGLEKLRRSLSKNGQPP